MAAKFLKPFRFGKGVLAFVTTRKSGNLSLFTGDHRKKVLSNRKRLAKALNISLNRLLSAQQVHKDKISVIKHLPATLKNTDAMVTSIPGICLAITTADCVPIILYDPKKRVIGAAHAGWRGTALNITKKTIKVMRKKFGSIPKDIIVGIGPSIGPCCYRVGPEVSGKFGHKGRANLDLQKINKEQLIKSGVRPAHIQILRKCTKCNDRTFFSSRASGGRTGRFIAGIMLK